MFYRIPEDQRWILEWFGGYSRTVGPGLTFIVPVGEKIRDKHLVKTQEITLFKEPIKIDFRNGSATPQRVFAFVKVVDPFKATYEIEGWKERVTELLESKMRGFLAGLNLEEGLQLRRNLLDGVDDVDRQELDQVLADWGIQISKVTLGDLDLDPSLIKARDELFRKQRDLDMALIEKEIRAKELTGSLVQMLSELTGLSEKAVQRQMKKDLSGFVEKNKDAWEKVWDILHRKMGIDGKAFFDFRSPNGTGPESWIALFKKFSSGGGPIEGKSKAVNEKEDFSDLNNGEKFFDHLVEKYNK